MRKSRRHTTLKPPAGAGGGVAPPAPRRLVPELPAGGRLIGGMSSGSSAPRASTPAGSQIEDFNGEPLANIAGERRDRRGGAVVGGAGRAGARALARDRRGSDRRRGSRRADLRVRGPLVDGVD